MGSDRSGPSLVDEHEAFMDLVAAYAMDAVDHLEEPVVEGHLVACAGCRHDLRRHHEILALLGAAAPATPPASVWRGIDRRGPAPTEPDLGAVIRPLPTSSWHTPSAASTPGFPSGRGAPITRASGTPATRSEASRRRSVPRPPRAALLVAAALVVLTGTFGVVAARQQDRAEQLTHDLAGSPVERAAAQAQADGRHHELPIMSADGHLHARILVDDHGSGYFLPSGMAELPAGRSYQLWGISSDGARAQPVSLGVLGARPGASAFQAPVTDTTYALTDEPAGGSQGPTTPVLASVTTT